MQSLRGGFRPWALIAVLTLLGQSGCSGGAGAPPPAAPVEGARIGGSACDRIALRPAGLSGILRAPVTQETRVPGDGQSCSYLTEGFPSITVSLRPGAGESTVNAWIHGKMPFQVTPIAGVGDSALWQPALHELIARKGALLCDIQVRAGENDFALAPDALPKAVGALCERIFDAP